MSLMRRFLGGSRVRHARTELADNPTAAGYAALASEHARLGEMDDLLRVCQEGLEMFPGSIELVRLSERARAIQREDRTRELYKELRESPRPAVYRELCQILLDSGRISRAEECAQEWFNASGDGQAQLLRAQARCERYFADRRREDGRLALELLDATEKLLPRDARPLRLRLSLASRIGAYQEARRVAMQLLELEPGDPALEARFRTLSSLAEKSPSIDHALRDVEKSGRLVDEETSGDTERAATGSVRPLLKELAVEPGVHAAIYVRGSTALIQGPRGATAERIARAVREVVQKSRTGARRLGLGNALEVTLEGGFGHLYVAPGELGAAALWSARPVQERQQARLMELTGMDGTTPDEDVA